MVKEKKEPEEKDNSENKDDEYIVPVEHGYYMCIMSSLSFLAGVYAIKQKLYALSFSPLIVFGTSVNYWRKPTYGLRRNIDIFFVVSSLSLHTYLSLQPKDMCINNYRYCYVTPISGILYGISWLLHKNQFLWPSTIAHGMIHVAGNIGNVLLYKGLS
jgi:accessory gene regulator protein AgrB